MAAFFVNKPGGEGHCELRVRSSLNFLCDEAFLNLLPYGCSNIAIKSL